MIAIGLMIGVVFGVVITLSLQKTHWGKWEVDQANVDMIETTRNPMLEYESKPRSVKVDILKRTNNKTGEIQYKNVTHY